jgi:flagellar hook-length control protein FliK
LSNVALDPIPHWPQRPEPGSNRAGSSSMDPSPNRFDALLDNTSSDVRPAPSEQYDRSRAPDRRDDTRAADDRTAAQSRAADDRAAAQSRAGDARAADRQKAADDRTAQVADDTKRQQDGDKAAAAKDRPAAGGSDATQAKAKPAANAADATQAQGKSQGKSQDKPADKPSDATQATATDTPAQPADPAAAAAAAAAQAKAATTAAAAVIGDAGTAVKKSGKTAEGDKDTAAAATTTPDPNAVVAQVVAIVVPVNPLAAIAPSAGAAAAKTADGIAPVDASLTPADAAGKPGAAAQAAAGTAAERAAAATAGADPKAADPAQQESFKALVEAAGAKTPPGADAKTGHTDKAKPAEQSKTASTNPAKPSATDAAQPAGAEEQVVKTGAATPHQAQPQSAEHAGLAGRPAASEVRADAITATAPANSQAGSNAPILPLNLAQPIALPLSTMFQVAAPKAGAGVDPAVPVAGLAVEIVSRAQEGGKRFDIRLDPPELGRVDVRLDVDDAGKVTSHLVVERSETLDLLRRDQPQLERALQQAGLNTDGGLQFSLRDQNSAPRDQTPRDNSANTSQLIVPDDEAAAAEAARRGYGRLLGRAGGVDIRI